MHLLLRPYLGVVDPTTKFLGSRLGYSITARRCAHEFPRELVTHNGWGKKTGSCSDNGGCAIHVTHVH